MFACSGKIECDITGQLDRRHKMEREWTEGEKTIVF